MDQPVPPSAQAIPESELVERLQWLLRLRWLIVPVFVAVDLANDLLTRRRAPWVALLIGVLLLLANAAYAWLLQRKAGVAALLRWSRFEAVLVVAIPVAVAVMHGEPDSPVRYGVLVGVVGAAVVLPRTSEVAIVAMWAVAALIVGDAIAMGFDPGRIDQRVVARWAWDTGIVVTVAIMAGHLHQSVAWVAQRLRSAQVGLEHAAVEWEASFDSLAEMVFICDLEGRLVRVNRAFGKLVGARPHELAGRRLADLLVGHPARWWSVSGAMLVGHPARWWSVSGDGIVEIEDPVFDSVFEVTSVRAGDRVVRVARDVGEHQRLYARLVQADKLAAVGALATGVAHEINSPTAFVTSNLTELKGYVSRLDEAVVELSELALRTGAVEQASEVLTRHALTFARREAHTAIAESLAGMERIRQVVGNLRSLARRDQAGEPAAPVELGEVVQTVVQTAAFELRNAAARVVLQGPVWVVGHRGELVDVVLNLVVNAVQARQDGRANQVAVELGRDGPHAVLRVADTGKGISAGHLKRLFEAYFTTKAPGEGAGLGLSLARKIVLSHGGSIDVTTEVGVGSTFTVRLPAVEPDGSRRGVEA